jgi:hypothetical protein
VSCCPFTAYAVEGTIARENKLEHCRNHYISFDMMRHTQDIVKNRPNGRVFRAEKLIVFPLFFMPETVAKQGKT